MATSVQWAVAVGLLVCAVAMVAVVVMLARLYCEVRRERIEAERALGYQTDWIGRQRPWPRQRV